jgi:hypothetical protein
MPATIHIRHENNLYWGGALNEAFKLVLKEDRYDSLLFLNNDIEVTAEVFVNLLRNELFSNDFAIVSPCIAGQAQPWKQMQNWGSRQIRLVKWIDNQAPLFHRKIIEAIGQFDPELYFGWGQELICFDISQERGWKIGVCDHISILHVGKQTFLQKRLFTTENSDKGNKEQPITMQESHTKAMIEYRAYFADHLLKHGDFEELRAYGEQYTYYEGLSETQFKNRLKQKPAVLKQLMAYFKTGKG